MGTVDSWSSIETLIRQRLEAIEFDRRYCAVCARQGPSLSRCFGCQMVYYCGEEHQIEDWSNGHGQRCAQLEWVALGELIRALPAQPPLPELGDKWPVPLKDVPTWIEWFSIRTNIVHLANDTANIFDNLVHLTDKRQPTHQNAVDGLLTAMTDLLTHVLTIGKAILSFGLQPQTRSLLIHILNGFTHDDLLDNEHSSSTLPSRFHELLNMFPDNKGVELLIVIGDDDDDDDDNDDESNENDPDQSSLPQAKLRPDRLIITTRNKRSRIDTLENKRIIPDLLVYLNAAYLFMGKNRHLFDTILAKQSPTLLTFEDEEEFHHARMYLSNHNIPIKQAGSNPFGSMMIRQRANRPNSTYSPNSYQILLNPSIANRSDDRLREKMSLYSHQSSIGIQHDQIGSSHQYHQQQLTPGLKQVNGRIHIQSPPMSHKTQANKNGTLLDTHVHIGSTTSSTTVQPSQPTNNNMRQPTVAQRRHHSTAVPSVMTNSMLAETRTPTPMNTIELTRTDPKPQPKPRLSLVKSNSKSPDAIPSESSTNLVQIYKPFFEQSNIQRPSTVNSSSTYQTVIATKVTCLDDIIPPQRVELRSPPPVAARPIEIQRDDRTMSAVQSPRDVRMEQRGLVISKGQTPSYPKSMTIESSNASPSPLLLMSNEIHSDQRTVNNRPSITSPPSAPAPVPHVEHRADSRTTAVISPPPPPPPPLPVETRTDSSPVPTLPRSPPPPPPLPSTDKAKTEVIYTEVIKNHERITSPTQPPPPLLLPTTTTAPTTPATSEMIKSPLSPSRSFVMPTKSPSISSSKTSSFNIQRSSRPLSTMNFAHQPQKSRPNPSMMTADRISLYSQRSSKQADVGVTIKNLSECIDRVGIVFDESHRPNDLPSTALTTVDLIREQLNQASMNRPSESLLDKLYKSNSSTRLSNNSPARKSFTIASPRSKSQQATRTPIEAPAPTRAKSPAPVVEPMLKTTPTPLVSTQTVRRAPGVFLPFTPKNLPDTTSSNASAVAHEPANGSVYQNLDSQLAKVESKIPIPPPPVEPTSVAMPQKLDYTLKQPTGPICTGIPRPFRKPTAIIEPSPVVPTITKAPEEPKYVNLASPEMHIYSNENDPALTGSSNSNSFSSKTSSIYSNSEKGAIPGMAQPHYAVTHVAPGSTDQAEQLVEYDSFDDELVGAHPGVSQDQPMQSHDNTDEDSFDDDEDDGQREQIPPAPVVSSKNQSSSFFRSTLNRLTRSNKSLDRVGLTLNDAPPTEPTPAESQTSNQVDNKAKKTLRSIKARHEAKKTGILIPSYTGDDDTTSIDSNCSTQTATSLNKASKSSHQRFRLFRRKIEKEFASDTEAEKHQTEQRRKKWNKKMLNDAANELKNQRLLMMTDDDDEGEEQAQRSHSRDPNRGQSFDDETHIYDHIIHEETNNQSSRMGKLSHETHFKSPTVTLDEIRSEIKAEIAARQEGSSGGMIPSNSIVNGSSSNLNLQKKRSKSVTFLDELLVDENDEKSGNVARKIAPPVKPATTTRRIEKGDARSICGALTGTGPIRGIIKAANNDITGTTAPVSPSAVTAAIYLSGTSIDPRCTSPKAHERMTHRPLSTYTVGSARFYDGASSTAGPTSVSTSSNQRPILTNGSTQSDRRPTAKVSPFQTKTSSNETSSSSPITVAKSLLKKPVRPSKNPNSASDMPTIPGSSISDGVGAVSKRMQSNF